MATLYNKNRFLVQRTAKVKFPIAPAAATTIATGVIVPKGAIVTGVRVLSPTAVTLTAASGTFQIAVGAVNVVATLNLSSLPAVSVPAIIALASTAGNFMTADCEISIIEGTSNNSTAAGTYDIYVDYLYVA